MLLFRWRMAMMKGLFLKSGKRMMLSLGSQHESWNERHAFLSCFSYPALACGQVTLTKIILNIGIKQFAISYILNQSLITKTDWWRLEVETSLAYATH